LSASGVENDPSVIESPNATTVPPSRCGPDTSTPDRKYQDCDVSG
jgi:hypothetical protein